MFLCNRVKLKDDVGFLGAKATNPVQWTVSQDVRSEGHRVVTLHCRRKDTSYGQRSVKLRFLEEDLFGKSIHCHHSCCGGTQLS